MEEVFKKLGVKRKAGFLCVVKGSKSEHSNNFALPFKGTDSF